MKTRPSAAASGPRLPPPDPRPGPPSLPTARRRGGEAGEKRGGLSGEWGESLTVPPRGAPRILGWPPPPTAVLARLSVRPTVRLSVCPAGLAAALPPGLSSPAPPRPARVRHAAAPGRGKGGERDPPNPTPPKQAHAHLPGKCPASPFSSSLCAELLTLSLAGLNFPDCKTGTSSVCV